jgi:hypothetical protein
MLQAGNNHQGMPYRDEHLAMDFAQQAVILDSERMTLTRKEYDLLALLVQHAGEIIPREALLMQVWGYSAEIRTRTLDVHVRRTAQETGRLCRSIHRDDLRYRIPLSAVPCSAILFASYRQAGDRSSALKDRSTLPDGRGSDRSRDRKGATCATRTLVLPSDRQTPHGAPAPGRPPPPP